MSDYQTGETVDITIGRALIDHVHEAPGLGQVLHVLYVDPIGDQRVIEVAVDAESVTVEYSSPPGWPPQSRDVWIDRDGDAWIGLGVDLAQALGDGNMVAPDVAARRYGPLRLVYRPGGDSDA
ncbi:hypothetical protein ACFHW1_05135 [Micromonospora sp. LOL_014]|uniref:hypothetical protein n=1 Tax=Micromonospora sp. LOL_014 TaxID=3345415 RepID=UPI003A88EA27